MVICIETEIIPCTSSPISFPSCVALSFHGFQEWWLCCLSLAIQHSMPDEATPISLIPALTTITNPMTFLYVIMVELVSVRLSIN